MNAMPMNTKMRFLTFLFCIQVFIFNANAQRHDDSADSIFHASSFRNMPNRTYDSATVMPISSFNLDSRIPETSGLIYWDGRLWTNNDDTDINLYSLDTSNGNIMESYMLRSTFNKDWEEISQDADYIYIGDFGNNANGNRADLKILRIGKNSLLTQSPMIDTIHFTYSDQTDFTPAGSNNTDFDCEAFIVSTDSIYLFTKQWVSKRTSVHSISKSPGVRVASLQTSFDVEGLITGATYLQAKRLVVLCGYSTLLQPFLYLLYDFHGSAFFGGNTKKIAIDLPFHQIEGIATADGLKYYITNEYLNHSPIPTIPQQLHILDLRPFLGEYLDNLKLQIQEVKKTNTVCIFPNPARDFITLKAEIAGASLRYSLINQLGRIERSGPVPVGTSGVDLSGLTNGLYFMRIGQENIQTIKILKQ